MYDLTNLTSSGDFSGLMLFSNEVTNGMFMTFMLMAIFFVLVMVMKRFDTIDAILSASFVCFVLAAILAYGHMVSFWMVVVFLTLLGFGVLYKQLAGR